MPEFNKGVLKRLKKTDDKDKSKKSEQSLDESSLRDLLQQKIVETEEYNPLADGDFDHFDPDKQ
ncbi:hypothetical protein [Legionella spiritensis]|uniref:Uncharacterized protein n=1 Tax=Legionella spiritensis TaxID=452 RepID=A0A0W0YXA0_LEGSP|nr:hypothetical protein [Legionella spiritensis]KTD61246.1 hypothetical protein Lspi_2866 [Legionella spiritensis]SNV23627.1 Uncharacterised protein [Legionella spiritensis]VEG91618.1 Uncharacterised protein [Legionella spiritensis]